MTMTRTADPARQDLRTQRPRVTALVGAAAAVLGAFGLLTTPAAAEAMSGMSMTHYMELLATNQPWNLLIFMAIPIILAETLAITELAILFSSAPPAWVKSLNRAAGLVAGPVMVGILLHLLRHAVAPLTSGGGWRGMADVIAVLAYLAGSIPLIGITLVELGILGRDAYSARKLHAIFVGAFLVVAHVAMIFGMLDPAVLGWGATHSLPGGDIMPGMNP